MGKCRKLPLTAAVKLLANGRALVWPSRYLGDLAMELMRVLKAALQITGKMSEEGADQAGIIIACAVFVLALCAGIGFIAWVCK